MPVIGFPSTLERILANIMEDSTLTSFKLAGSGPRLTLVLRFDSAEQGLSSLDRSSQTTPATFRKKPPSQLRRDKNRLQHRFSTDIESSSFNPNVLHHQRRNVGCKQQAVAMFTSVSEPSLFRPNSTCVAQVDLHSDMYDATSQNKRRGLSNTQASTESSPMCSPTQSQILDVVNLKDSDTPCERDNSCTTLFPSNDNLCSILTTVCRSTCDNTDLYDSETDQDTKPSPSPIDQLIGESGKIQREKPNEEKQFVRHTTTTSESDSDEGDVKYPSGNNLDDRPIEYSENESCSSDTRSKEEIATVREPPFTNVTLEPDGKDKDKLENGNDTRDDEYTQRIKNVERNTCVLSATFYGEIQPNVIVAVTDDLVIEYCTQKEQVTRYCLNTKSVHNEQDDTEFIEQNHEKHLRNIKTSIPHIIQLIQERPAEANKVREMEPM